MVVTVRSLGLGGLSGYEVSVECFLSGGLPAFDIVGLPDTAVKEARERVRAAAKSSGWPLRGHWPENHLFIYLTTVFLPLTIRRM